MIFFGLINAPIIFSIIIIIIIIIDDKKKQQRAPPPPISRVFTHALTNAM